jgi:replicative DNA helicase
MTDIQKLKAVEKLIHQVYEIKQESYQSQRDQRETWPKYRRRVKKLANLEIRLFHLFDLDIAVFGALVQPPAARK